jgi:hypothetical protein
MSEYSEFFLNSKASIVELELLQISHSSFTQTWNVVRNATEGVTVLHEDEEEYQYDYYPMRLSASQSKDDLDYSLKVEFGDLGEIISNEIDAVRNDDNFIELPKVVYRVYRSDNLEAPMYGPIVLEIKAFDFTKDGAMFEAKAPSLNLSSTGETYSLPRFPMLRGLL